MIANLSTGPNKYHFYLLAIVSMIVMADAAHAWQSGPEPAERQGPGEARQVWSAIESNPPNEHAELLQWAMQMAGMPGELGSNEPYFEAIAYVDRAKKVAGLSSVEPVDFAIATGVAKRPYTINGFAGLPDHSFSLWDWAAGNEHCPEHTILGTAMDPSLDVTQTCHRFDTHLGFLNSTHFVPQSQETYNWYHNLAIDRAKQCKNLAINFKASPSFALSDMYGRMRQMVQECEREAMIIESIAQHFLQDAWAMGHMWERWGYPTFYGFPGSTRKEQQEYAALVAMTAGSIHGFDAATLILDIVQVNNGDQMSFGRDTEVLFVEPGGGPPFYFGVGDLYVDTLLSEEYDEQRNKLLLCSEAGIVQVYDETDQWSGERVGPKDIRDPVTTNEVDPASDYCFGQRATNSAIASGWGFHIDNPILRGLGLAPVRIASPKSVSSLVLRKVPELVSIPDDLRARYRSEMVFLASRIALMGKEKPGGTNLAQKDLITSRGSGKGGTFLGVPLNGSATAETPPATYADPSLPWPNSLESPAHIQTPERNARWIARLFNQAHVADWCTDAEAAPSTLKGRVAAAPAAETPAACAACVEMASRQVRLQGKESICEAATDSFLATSIDGDAAATETKIVAQQYCGCAPALKITINDTRSGWTLPTEIIVKGLNSPRTWPFYWAGEGTCGGERGYPSWSAEVEPGADFYAATVTTGVPTDGHFINYRPCSSFVAIAGTGATPEERWANPSQVWANATGRARTFGGSTIDWEFQTRYSSGDWTSHTGEQLTVGLVTGSGYFGGMPASNFSVELTYDRP